MSTTFVYVWVGINQEADDFDNYIHIGYTEDGDSIPSQFMLDADIEFYDEDGQEFVNHEKGEAIDTAFTGHSYYDSFKNDLLNELKNQKIDKIYSQYLIYDMEDRIEFNSKPKNKNLKYVGEFMYNVK